MSTSNKADTETVETRPLSVVVRAKARNFYTQFPYDKDSDTIPGQTLPESRHTEFSPTGDHFVTVEGDDSAAVIRSAVDGSPLSTCGGKNDAETPLLIAFATFSPLGSYLLTWARPAAGVNAPNLVVYRVPTGERLAAFHQKTFHLDFWPSIQWSNDESTAARSVTNTVHFFHGDALHEPPTAKLGIPGIVKFSLSHGQQPYSIAAFIGGTGGQNKNGPMKVAMYQHPDQGGERLSFRSTFRADSVKFLWNSKGTACLAHISTNVDATGENYYGESYVIYMNNDGSLEKRVELPKKGPVHDVAWSPTGNEFIIVYGNMPSLSTMFDEKCEPLFDFGTGSRNTVSFSPHGRYVALAGFGNLPGAVEFWDKNRTELVGKSDLPCTTMMSWSACSRYFLAATTFPRLRVDNAVRVVRFDGKKIFHHEYGKEPLHQATFRTALRGTYADPKFTAESMIGGPVEHVTSGSGNAANGGGGVYRPPGSRGAAPTFKLNEHIKPGKVNKATFMTRVASVAASSKSEEFGSGSASVSAAKRFVPGMDPDLMNTKPSKSALARKKKKERQAADKLAQVQSRLTPNGKLANGGSSANNADNELDIATVEAGEKIVKKLRKKLRAIENLKTSREEGKKLTREQVEKLETEAIAAQQLAVVQKKLAELSSS